MKLSSYSQGRNNNFNLIRIVAAFAVLVSHSFTLAIGIEDAELLLKANLRTTLGLIAVDIFFITSGFLVTASLLTRQSVIEFAWARVLRIFPALLVMLSLTVFGLGVFFTSLPLSSYFSDKTTYIYLVKCSTLFTGVEEKLPGVFESNPWKSVVNGALWTMPYEVRGYALLAFIWLSVRITRDRLKAFKRVVIVYAVGSGISVLVSFFYYSHVVAWLQLSFMFFTGAAFYVLKEHILLSRRFFWPMMIALLLAVRQAHVFFVVYIFSIAYLLFFLAYVPAGHVRKYNLLGDYSYGIYIYAFPVQQSVAALIPGVSVLNMFLISAAATILLSVLSWHLLERRVLSLKGQCANDTRRWLSSLAMFPKVASNQAT